MPTSEVCNLENFRLYIIYTSSCAQTPFQRNTIMFTFTLKSEALLPSFLYLIVDFVCDESYSISCLLSMLRYLQYS